MHYIKYPCQSYSTHFFEALLAYAETLKIGIISLAALS
jgi:hypothetical protein